MDEKKDQNIPLKTQETSPWQEIRDSLEDTPDSLWAHLVVFVALVAAIVTFFFLMGGTSIEPDEQSVRFFLSLDIVLILALFGLVYWHLRALRKARRLKHAGVQLQRRVIRLFSLVAAVPTTLVAGAGIVALERGLNPWFSGDLKTLVESASEISQSFQQQICQNLGREMRLMATDIDRANATGFFLGKKSSFQVFLNGRAEALGFPYAVIFKEDGSLLEKAEITSQAKVEPPALSAEDFRDAGTDEPPCLFSSHSIGGLISLKNFGSSDTYLMVARAIDPRMLEFPLLARAGVTHYQILESRRRATQLGIVLVFTLMTLIGLLSAILLGFGFAAKLVDPIRRLIQATDQFSSGRLYVEVPLEKIGRDLSPLAATFNNMTRVLSEQHESLKQANLLIDRRRHFMEAVLSGVPAGVFGLDSEGNISLANPMACALLELADIQGENLTELLPELAPFLDEARHSPASRLVQAEIKLRQKGGERILSVRIASDFVEGFVVTLDDITDLVNAQRSSAWADVARRIAHEIKNPLTPIQLSAERISRKFGRLIVDDRPIFDQCVATIIRQVDDIKRMVDEFSSFARMPKPQMGEDDLKQTLREVLFLMRVAHPAIVFEDHLPDTPLRSKFDRRLIAQALQNILKNACESIESSENGKKGEGRIFIHLGAALDNEIVLDIQDNGKGFPQENRQKLLEPYVTTREGGTGLGLPIVAKIFEDHNGRIELRDPENLEEVGGAETPQQTNAPKMGAIVRVVLPKI